MLKRGDKVWVREEHRSSINRTTGEYYRGYNTWETATFHQFGMEYTIINGTPVRYSCALLEYDRDGKLSKTGLGAIYTKEPLWCKDYLEGNKV